MLSCNRELATGVNNHDLAPGNVSEKLEKAGTVDLKKHPARKAGARSRQCGPKVPRRFAFPGARNPGICSISRLERYFPAIFPGTFPEFSLEASTAFFGFGKRGLLEKGSFQKSPFLEMLENLEILEFLENSQTVEKKGVVKTVENQIFWPFFVSAFFLHERPKTVRA